MYLYGLFSVFGLFIGVNTFKTIHHNKIISQLFAKKTITKNSYLYKPKTIHQESYLKYLNNDDTKIIISIGPAGTGKTLLACQKAIMQMKSEELDKIIITRPIVTIEEDIGFLPGNINKKMDPWTKPIFDIFLEYYSKTEIDMLLNNGKIEICPLVFMRGRTFKNSFIIADEMQNSSPNQMQMLVTRLGINSRMVITGDLNQTDIKKENGLNDFIKKVEFYNNTELIKIIRFDSNDIERSEIVKKVIEIYSYKHYNIVSTAISNNVTIEPINNITIGTNNTSVKNNTIKTQSKQIDYSIFNKFVSNKNISIDNDAALIPKKHIAKSSHISYNHDIFFEPRDF
jgi:phosphate starvation-inducible PhoH-like protein